ncbi:L-histidine N(alpha)-methyltransferase [Rufibacter immobilis]|uniref:4-dimethylallyltryptophan N-methyltransferase n=1 Tax=Rufibacter immobilis TaxID=1348778 RepID=A0A3M9MRH2_9BACT|nr:L-histidine N(alpha)-methyltransferase [Rufibacter immobilis]RNI27483.1 L-histidine N(alpha)-methyltransferase [Rufibacter immobilis]
MTQPTTNKSLVNLLPQLVSTDNGLAQDVRQGLSQNPKKLSSRFFYDAKGSQLFQQIMELPEYYLTKLEHQILSRQRKEILYAIDTATPFQLVDLGAGDAYKTKLLLSELVASKVDFSYVPLDISEDQLNLLLEDLHHRWPQLPVTALAAEYFQGLAWLNQEKPQRKVVLFLGSNIGNFHLQEAQEFLCTLRKSLNPHDSLLLGLDLRKDPEKMRRAYADAAGVTSAFNLNLLHRINKELHADFDLDQFQHFAEYDPLEGTMRSFLISRKAQQVHIGALNETFEFEAWEAIHTENSYKFSLRQVEEMAQACGYRVQDVYTDASHGFADVLLRPVES